MNNIIEEQLGKLDYLIIDGKKIGLVAGYDVCGKKEIKDFLKQSMFLAVENALKEAVNTKFPRGKRKWCIECATRIKKDILKQLGV